MTQVSSRIGDHLKADGERLFKSGDPFYSESNQRELERRAREMDLRENASEH